MCAIRGWKKIARLFDCSPSHIIKYKDEMISLGVIFYMRHGNPPRKEVHAFPWKLMAWQTEKTKNGDFL